MPELFVDSNDENAIKQPFGIWIASLVVFFISIFSLASEQLVVFIFGFLLVASFVVGVIAFIIMVVRVVRTLLKNESFKSGLGSVISYGAFIIFGLFLLRGCTSSGSSSSGGGRYYDDYDSYDYYEEPVTSDSWDCTSDCSGHEAGYEWAEDKGITDPDDCGGNSDSFIEGCEAYANEYNMDNYDEEYYDDYDYYY
ncbi:MAG: hypothetical protein GW762_01360 [Candidatus Pacebacteria bacterium]|nr:hypothetical protein [Candidatus Paceibacterota bacterium]PIR63321.1 MAG: hypothetical protein COU64_05050 [Candidatus Pacebacteria bacterium CG10_big_fil_rev_8_21_14_0_10_40_26]PIZ79033.1 MAG: hypothetical protein COY01_01240 [Candidatus Pacebacteria bacterium CG_4_10_14_0_2_um_filter_40_20]PJA68521.1 MAG: hypothetical protein CO156_04780 [Candidatus Pacebacteria bacterium CG_4_9_14_3_um_filter_40_12]PJC41905.1 MAG: hypothetical protein CO041_02030 [Candidatus Pacebacteria bacterium CG_4_9_